VMALPSDSNWCLSSGENLESQLSRHEFRALH
jgi:hypothetical protein